MRSVTQKYMNRRALLTLADLKPEDISEIGDIAFRYSEAPTDFAGKLKGKRVGFVFIAPSTRTRASFWSAATTLGCNVLHMGAADLQLATGETWNDTGKILANYLDAVVVRSNGPQHELTELSTHIPATINALTYHEHPTQAIADLCAMREHFGDIKGLRIAYLGEVNNTARALALLVCKLPFERLDVYSPDGLGFPEKEIAALNAIRDGNPVRQHFKLPLSPDPADIVYTTRWHSMDKPRHDRDWLSRFAQFAITKKTITSFSGSKEAVFMHDLPAIRGQEVESDVLDGVNTTSLVMKQVHHKTSAAASSLLWSMSKT